MKNNTCYLLLSILFIAATTFVQAQPALIIPRPDTIQYSKGSFSLTPSTVVVVNNEGERNSANFFTGYVKKLYGFTIRIVNRSKAPASNYILLSTRTFIKAPDNGDHYTLAVIPASIAIEGDSYSGTFYGMQTLIQLLPLQKNKKLAVPAVTIQDQPRFAYRGMHLDVARHFFPVEYVKQYIDFLALHKLNKFHWHLTDDQGWRIEIKKYPRLTEVGGYRNGTIIGRYPGKGNTNERYGGFYTQEQIKEVVQYAADRFIDVIPEIEMPGHSSAAIAAYPFLSCFPDEATKAPAGTTWSGPTTGKQVQQAWGVFDDVYCAGKEETFTFLQDVLDEVIPLFPSNYVHVGGDENPKGNWKRCPRCQQRMKGNNLKNEHELQSYFTQRMEKFVNSKGKKIIGWDEILEGGLAPNATVMSWRGDEGGIEAAKQKHDAIMTPEPYLYLNWSQTRNEDSVSFGRYTPIEKVYSYEPVPKKLDAANSKYILGPQANLWTEYINNTSILEYNLFPRLSAVSEMAWSSKRNWNDFEKRLQKQIDRYDFLHINHSNAYFEIKDTVTESKTATLNWTLTSPIPHTFIRYDESNKSGKKTSQPFPATLAINKSGEYIATLVDLFSRKEVSTLKRFFALNKATGKKITLKIPPSTTYPGNGGAFGLVNGLSGKDFNAKEWQGWNGKNMEAVIDLGKPVAISTVSIGVWKQEPSWIYLPKAVEVYASADGNNWTLMATETNASAAWPDERKITVKLPANTNTQFVKVIAINHGTIAAGRAGEGRPAWLFVDEIEVN